MYLLDTNHLTILQRGGRGAITLEAKLQSVAATEIATTVVSYEEQTRGWLSYMAKARTIEAQVEAYRQLEQHIEIFRNIPVVSFDMQSALVFQNLRKLYPRIGTMDLKIAACTMANNAVLLTRNFSDFSKIVGLLYEDWTI
jgi:tRNA(fMet)-specific endonuclease VapC